MPAHATKNRNPLPRPGEHIEFGVDTDPYQPLERRQCVMRKTLTRLTRAEGLSISITTMSALVTRDIDLLRKIARRNSVRIDITLTTVDPDLARFLDPRAPTPATRLAALRTLRDAGISAGVLLMPVLPGLTDSEAQLRSLLRAAHSARAEWVGHRSLVLESDARDQFLAALRPRYPEIAARYERWTRRGRNVPWNVRRGIASRLRVLATAAGVALRDSDTGAAPPPPVAGIQGEFAFA